MSGNEDKHNWDWFMRNLSKAFPVLHVYNTSSQHSGTLHFSFISDRDKGLKEWLQKDFGNNHLTHCAVHIAANVQKYYGQHVSVFIPSLTKSHSLRYVDECLEDIKKMSKKAYEYLKAIPKNKWLSSEWLLDASLPPIYGITSSNISESLNNMFEPARNMAWLSVIEFIVNKMTTRISSLRKKYKVNNGNRIGIVDNRIELINKNWDDCAGFQVDLIEEEPEQYLVHRPKVGDLPIINHNVLINTKYCTCGKWQDMDVPCVDACSIYRLIYNHQITYAYEKVSRFYKINTLNALYTRNIEPVIIDVLKYDKVTDRPNNDKKPPGRPKKKRIRKRQKPVPKLVVKCSKCGLVGHNIRGCKSTTKK
jgi:hypothetical protein